MLLLLPGVRYLSETKPSIHREHERGVQVNGVTIGAVRARYSISTRTLKVIRHLLSPRAELSLAVRTVSISQWIHRYIYVYIQYIYICQCVCTICRVLIFC